MDTNKIPVCLIVDKTIVQWINIISECCDIINLYCEDENIRNYIKSSLNIPDTKIHKNDIYNFLNNLNVNEIDLIILCLIFNKFHEDVLNHIIKEKKFFYVISCFVPTLNTEKLKDIRQSYNNFNSTENLIYDVKEEFKEENKQFYYHIFNPLLSERAFSNLKDMLSELGMISGVNIHATFIPFFEDSIFNENNALFYRTMLITSLINYIFGIPLKICAKIVDVKMKNKLNKSLSGYFTFETFPINFNISVNTDITMFEIVIYGTNGFINLIYNHEHKCFQIQRCLNHYEYPQLFVENSRLNTLSETKYFIKQKYCTNKYINTYIDAIYITWCLWKCDGNANFLKMSHDDNNMNCINKKEHTIEINLLEKN